MPARGRLALVFGLSLGLCLAACGSRPNEERILGEWRASDRDEGGMLQYLFRADGTGETSHIPCRWRIVRSSGDEVTLEITNLHGSSESLILFDGNDEFTNPWYGPGVRFRRVE